MIANHKGEIPVVVLLLPFLAGIALGFNLLPGVNVNWLIVPFLLLVVTFVFLNLKYSRFKLYKARWVGGSLITLILFLFGWISVVKYSELNNSDHFSKTPAQHLILKINNEPILKNGLLRFTAVVEASVNKNVAIPTSGTLLVTIKDSSTKNLYYGDELLIPAKYNTIEPPLVPAEFNYKRYLANKNIYYQAYLFPKQAVLLAHNKGNSIIAYSLRLRQHLVEKLKRSMRDTDAIAVASTLILGYKTDLSNDIRQVYTKTGTVHVLSVSGAQVAVIYALLVLLLGFLDKYKYGKLLKAIIIISLIWYYCLFTGFSTAVCRAALMVSMVIIGKTFNRYINTLNLLAISAFILLVYDPFFIADVGFQLSFTAIFGLVVFQPVVYKWFTFKNKWANKLWSLCSASIAAQVIIFPLSAFYFHQFPVYFLISNLFVIIPVAVIMYSGIVYLLLPQIPILSGFIAAILENTIILMNKTLAIIEHIPYASINKIWIDTQGYVLLYIIIISLFYFMYAKKVWLLQISLITALLFCVVTSIKTIRLQNEDSIAWLNLKKHKGIVFKHGDGAIVISDLVLAGKTYQYSIQPYLDSCRINHIILVPFNKDFESAWFKKKYNMVQFLNKRILIFDRPLQGTVSTVKLKTDFIYLTDNQHVNIFNLNNSLHFNLLIIDGSNSDKTVGEIIDQAHAININYNLLKRNISLISVSN